MHPDIPVRQVLNAIGFDREATDQPVSGGADALLWKVTAGADVYALRLLRPDQRGQAESEVRLSHWINQQSPSIVVPEVQYSGFWNDHPAYLMRWIDGQVLGNALIDPALDPQNAIELAAAFGETQASIHSISPPPELQLFTNSWRIRLGGDLMFEALSKELRSEHALLHLDYHPLNVLIEHDQLVSVLDWANAESGDHRIDLARTEAILELAPVPPGTDPEVIKQFIIGWKRGYGRIAGPFELPTVFRWWAGSLIDLELTPRVGMASLPWLDDAYITRVREWTRQFHP